jgi:hypothetical protein
MHSGSVARRRGMGSGAGISDARQIALLAYQQACASRVAGWQAVAHLLAACFPKSRQQTKPKPGLTGDAKSTYAPFAHKRQLGACYALTETMCEVTFADGVTVRPSALAWGGKYLHPATGARAAVGRFGERARNPDTYLIQVLPIAPMRLLGDHVRDLDPYEANRATETCRTRSYSRGPSRSIVWQSPCATVSRGSRTRPATHSRDAAPSKMRKPLSTVYRATIGNGTIHPIRVTRQREYAPDRIRNVAD